MLQASSWKRVSTEILLCLLVFPAAYLLARLLLPEAGPGASPFVISWWAGLCALATFNLCLWLISYRAFGLRQDEVGDAGTYRKWQLILSLIYVAGCAQRSYWPKVDVQRFCMTDSWLSSIFVGRSVATVAEIAFAVQWALFLREYSRDADFRLGRIVSLIVVPLIVIAQMCCWSSVISSSFLGHVFEESIWTFTALLMAICIGYLWTQSDRQRGFLGTILAFCVCYILYMSMVDVPMYITRWLADQETGRVLFGFQEGMQDVLSRKIVTHRWEDWASEISWFSLYFSLAVWASIGCAHVPRFTKSR